MGAAFGFLSVALGAFGAHALKGTLDAESLAIYQTGVQYQFGHALAILFAAILLQLNPDRPIFRLAGKLFGAGIVMFSGSLYILAISGVKWLGAITPLGGVLFLAGWITLLVGAVSRPVDLRS